MQNLAVQISDAPYGLVRVHSSADNGGTHYLKRSAEPHEDVLRLHLEHAEAAWEIAGWTLIVRAYTDRIVVMLEQEIPGLAEAA